MPREDKRVAVVSAKGSCLDRQAVDALSAEVRAARDSGAAGVVVEASSVERTEVDGLAALLAWADDQKRATGAKLALAAPSRALLLAICQTRLQRELDVYGNSEAALRDLGGAD